MHFPNLQINFFTVILAYELSTMIDVSLNIIVKENDLYFEAVDSLCCSGPISQAVIENRLQ